MNNEDWARWSDIHNEPDQLKRQKSASGTPCTPITIDRDDLAGSFRGSSGNHTTCLDHCTCIDFNRRKKPCKHMYRLAMELGLFDGDYKSNERDIPRVTRNKPKNGISISDARKVIDTLSIDEQKFLMDVIHKIKYTYHSEYVPVATEDIKTYSKLFDCQILEESKNTEIILNIFPRNELNKRIIEADPTLQFKKNMKRTALLEWIKQTIPDKTDAICKGYTSVIVTDQYLKSRHKMYLYLREKFDPPTSTQEYSFELSLSDRKY